MILSVLYMWEVLLCVQHIFINSKFHSSSLVLHTPNIRWNRYVVLQGFKKSSTSESFALFAYIIIFIGSNSTFTLNLSRLIWYAACRRTILNWRSQSAWNYLWGPEEKPRSLTASIISQRIRTQGHSIAPDITLKVWASSRCLVLMCFSCFGHLFSDFSILYYFYTYLYQNLQYLLWSKIVHVFIIQFMT